MVKKVIENIVKDYLEGKEFFLVDIELKKGNLISVTVDGDKGITIDECVKISRLIESRLNRDEEDFELRVSSPGIDKPFKLVRQYRKYIDREIGVWLNDDRHFEGVLKLLGENEFTLEIKPGKKEKEVLTQTILFSEIKEAKPVVRI